MAQGGFRKSGAGSEPFSGLDGDEVVNEGGPHLKDSIRKPELENGSRNRLICRHVPSFDGAPNLFATGIVEPLQAIRLAGAEPRGGFRQRISMSQLFFCPGAILWNFSVIGEELVRRRIHRLAKQGGVPARQGTRPPLPSGLSGTMSERMARTFCGTHPARKGRAHTCRPRSPMTPYSPLYSIIRFQLMGLFGSRSLECRKPALTSMTRPKALRSMASPIRCAPG